MKISLVTGKSFGRMFVRIAIDSSDNGGLLVRLHVYQAVVLLGWISAPAFSQTLDRSSQSEAAEPQQRSPNQRGDDGNRWDPLTLANVSPAEKDADGILVHSVESPFQKGRTEIRVLLPSKVAASERLPTVYVLPVERGRETRYGDGLVEIQRRGLADKHRAVFVGPTFSALPWYADHPSQSDIRQESYFLQVVVPFVEANYPVLPRREDRLLLGFSKSGWGAWSLLLRHPDHFGRAAAWDAPLMMAEPGRYGSGEIFGTPDNFDRYRIAVLLRSQAESLRSDESGPAGRLVLTGYGNFRDEHLQMHDLLDELRIPHLYRDGPERKHDWHSGWVSESVELLFAGRHSKATPSTRP